MRSTGRAITHPGLKIIASLLALGLVVVGSYVSNPANAAPVKCAEGDMTLDDRVFPEPELSATFLRFDEFECGIQFLEMQHPELIEVTKVGKSQGGHPLYNVLLTNEKVHEKKKKLLVVSSIHGNEVGGREGAVRVHRGHGGRALPRQREVGQESSRPYVIHFLFPNPDGWVAGDIAGTEGAGIQSTRGNGEGLDLNRQFPVTGTSSETTLPSRSPKPRTSIASSSEPRRSGTTGTSEPTTTAKDPTRTRPQVFRSSVSSTIRSPRPSRASPTGSPGTCELQRARQLGTLNDADGQDIGPYHWGTLYDMLGYSASGLADRLLQHCRRIDGWGFATELTVGSEVNRCSPSGCSTRSRSTRSGPSTTRCSSRPSSPRGSPTRSDARPPTSSIRRS